MKNSLDSVKLGYYIHHEGNGHIQRALELAPYLSKKSVTYFSSHPRVGELAPFGNILILPLDTDIPHFPTENKKPIKNHLYCPFYSEGLAKRFHLILDWIVKEKPGLFHVDVSTEVAEFVTLCGVPFTYVRQSGDRTDSAHTRIYNMAQKIFAPYPEWMEDPLFKEKFKHTSFYALSKKNTSKPTAINKKDTILYLRSSTEEDSEILIRLQESLEELAQRYKVTIVGTPLKECRGIKNMGWSNLADELINEAGVVLCSVGNNTILELLQLRKPLIMLPEKKAFQEQLQKAKLINRHLGVPYFCSETLAPEDLIREVQKCFDGNDRSWPEIPNEAFEFSSDLLRLLDF